MTGQDDIDWTTCAFEFPEAYAPGHNEAYYPIPREDNRAIFRKYEVDARKLDCVTFVGRLADYNYYNMDQAVASALELFRKTGRAQADGKRRLTTTVEWYRNGHENRNDMLRFGMMRLHRKGEIRYLERSLLNASTAVMRPQSQRTTSTYKCSCRSRWEACQAYCG